MKESSVRLLINRFAEESMLMVVDNHTEEITPFNLNPKEARFLWKRKRENLYSGNRRRRQVQMICLLRPFILPAQQAGFLFSMIQHADQHFPLQRVSIAGRMYPLQQPETVLPQLAFEHDTTFCLF